MTGFWIGAALLALAALALLFRPRRGLLALLVGVVAVALAVVLYRAVGATRLPEQSATERQARAEIRALQAETRARPTDPAAWLTLGRSYLQFEQYRLAEIALTTANRLYDGRNATVLAALAEAMALDGDDANDGQVATLFEDVLRLEPRNPKALFYTGLKALNDGRLPLARERFSAMLGPDVPPQITAMLQKQIAAIDAELAGGKGAPAAAAPAAATGVRLEIDVSPALRGRIDALAKSGAVLFVFARNPAGGPPLAVRRMSTRLPIALTLSADDAVVAGNAIQPKQSLMLVARISASGGPSASRGDLYGEAQAVAGGNAAVKLVIDRIAN